MTTPLSGTSLDRRRFLIASGVGGAAFVATQMFPLAASADVAAMRAAMKKTLGDKKPQMGRVSIDAPEIAENGNTVPISVEVKSAMKGADMVKAVHVWAEGNPRPEVASFHFSPLSGAARASTRMRLAKTQHIYAVAQMANGDLFMAKRLVKVTIGGCGG
jgi:sulfur-oxidizing protein SoxY